MASNSTTNIRQPRAYSTGQVCGDRQRGTKTKPRHIRGK